MSAPHRRATTKHIAVLAFPFGSHAPPVLSLVRRLSEAASDVHIRFSFFSTAKSNASTFPPRRSIEVGDHKPKIIIKAYDVGDGLPDGYVFGGNQLEVVELFLNGAAERFKKEMEAAEAEIGEAIGCLISDAFLWFVGDMAEEMKVPWVALWTSGPRSLFIHLHTDLIRDHIKSSGSKEASLEFLAGFSETEMRVGDLCEEVVSASLESPFANMLYKMAHRLPQATSVLVNSFQQIDPQMHSLLTSKLPNYLDIGPFKILVPPPPCSDDHGCLPWLDKHPPKSVVYISFGGFASLPPHEVEALADALEESGFPFLWSFRGNLARGGAVESTGKIVPWAPQVKILGHSSVGVFVTHGGWNSVLESVAGGVPMIGRPFLGDHGLNMKTVESVWGIGLGLEGGVFTKTALLKALRQVLATQQGKLMRDKAQHLKALAHNAAQSTTGSSSPNFALLLHILTNSNFQLPIKTYI